MKLSYSAGQKFLNCGYSWKLHYQDKLRSEKIGSALFFGSSLDDALNCLVLSKKKNLTDSEKLLINNTPEQTFISSLQTVFINGDPVDIRKSELAEYYKSDYDKDLLTDQDYSTIVAYARELGIDTTNLDDLDGFIKQFQKIKNPDNINEVKLYNFTCWHCLKEKGLMLLDHYRTEILPKIEEVYSIQRKVSLPDNEDEFIGFIDLELSFKDEPGVIYTTDHKTSSRAYPEDSVRESEQLASYCEFTERNKGCYIVLEKKIRKRHPRVRSQIIRDTIPESQFEKTFDNLSEVFYSINENNFEKNMDNCFQYGRKCCYYDYCRNGSTKGLVNLKEKNNGNKS